MYVFFEYSHLCILHTTSYSKSKQRINNAKGTPRLLYMWPQGLPRAA